eukprot:8513413-Pyramimonas_sp.AAC.1
MTTAFLAVFAAANRTTPTSHHSRLIQCLMPTRPALSFDGAIILLHELSDAPPGGDDRGGVTHSEAPAASERGDDRISKIEEKED